MLIVIIFQDWASLIKSYSFSSTLLRIASVLWVFSSSHALWLLVQTTMLVINLSYVNHSSKNSLDPFLPCSSNYSVMSIALCCSFPSFFAQDTLCIHLIFPKLPSTCDPGLLLHSASGTVLDSLLMWSPGRGIFHWKWDFSTLPLVSAEQKSV